MKLITMEYLKDSKYLEFVEYMTEYSGTFLGLSFSDLLAVCMYGNEIGADAFVVDGNDLVGYLKKRPENAWEVLE